VDSIRQFWAGQAASLNRESGKEFYRKKAREHAAILSAEDAQRGALDLGCGAGELLECLAALVKVNVGLDYSASMVAAARQRLASFADLDLQEADVFDYLPTTGIAVWMTTGALNQYFAARDLRRVLDLFVSNAAARSFYLFDCIDPLRYRVLPFGSSYRSQHALAAASRDRLKRAARRLRVAAKFAFGGYSADVQYLGSASMGYGQLPRFWLRECASRGLSAEITSSRYYEYRYHVQIAKGTGSAGNAA
jgi:cyclopropane-fatty-acyl-phospholipid synthase